MVQPRVQVHNLTTDPGSGVWLTCSHMENLVEPAIRHILDQFSPETEFLTIQLIVPISETRAYHLGETNSPFWYRLMVVFK